MIQRSRTITNRAAVASKQMRFCKRICVLFVTICLLLGGCATQDDLDAAYDQGRNAGYSIGYDEGRADGYQEGRQVGYRDGYEEAEKEAYSKGYDDGVSVGIQKGRDEKPPERSFLAESSYTVYVTNTGSKYHKSGCSYLKSKIAIDYYEAVRQGYGPCSRCDP